MADSATATPAAPERPPVRGLASLAAALGIGAVGAAAACCVLPLALASIGIGAGLAGGLAVLAGVRTPVLLFAAAAVAAAWVVWWRRRATACAPGDACAAPTRSRAPLALLILATALVALAAMLPLLEPMLMSWLS